MSALWYRRKVKRTREALEPSNNAWFSDICVRYANEVRLSLTKTTTPTNKQGYQKKEQNHIMNQSIGATSNHHVSPAFPVFRNHLKFVREN